MNHTIKVRHLLSKEAIQNIEQMQASVQRMVNSDGFRNMLKVAESFEKIAKINIATFYSSPSFQNLQNTIEIMGKNRSRILAAFTQIQAPQLTQPQNPWIPSQIEPGQKPSKTKELVPKSEFVLLEYQIEMKDKRIQELESKNIFLIEENTQLKEKNEKHRRARVKGATTKHQAKTLIKEKIVYPLYLDPKFGKNPHHISKAIYEKIENLMISSEDEKKEFSEKHDIDFQYIKLAERLHGEDDFPVWNTFYTWCKKFKTASPNI